MFAKGNQFGRRKLSLEHKLRIATSGLKDKPREDMMVACMADPEFCSQQIGKKFTMIRRKRAKGQTTT